MSTRRGQRRSEASIENAACTALFKKRGAIARKLNGMGARDWPDRLYCGPSGFHIFIEFKKPGETSTPSQARKQAELAQLGHYVGEAHSVDEALELYDAAFQHHHEALRHGR